MSTNKINTKPKLNLAALTKITISAICSFFISDILHFGFHKIEATSCPPKYARLALLYRYTNDLFVAMSINFMGSRIAKKNMEYVIIALMNLGLAGLIASSKLVGIMNNYPIFALINHITLAWLSHAIVSLCRIYHYDPAARKIINDADMSKYEVTYFLMRGLLYSVSKIIFYAITGRITVEQSWIYYGLFSILVLILKSKNNLEPSHQKAPNDCCGGHSHIHSNNFTDAIYNTFKTLCKMPHKFTFMYIVDIVVSVLHKKFHDYHICAMHSGQAPTTLVSKNLADFQITSSLVVGLWKIWGLVYNWYSYNLKSIFKANTDINFSTWAVKNIIYILMRIANIDTAYSYYYYNSIRRGIGYHKYSIPNIEIGQRSISELETLQLGIMAIAAQINF